jgi:hypothetical protein
MEQLWPILVYCTGILLEGPSNSPRALVKIFIVPAEIRRRHLQNKNQNCYGLSKPARLLFEYLERFSFHIIMFLTLQVISI